MSLRLKYLSLYKIFVFFTQYNIYQAFYMQLRKNSITCVTPSELKNIFGEDRTAFILSRIIPYFKLIMPRLLYRIIIPYDLNITNKLYH